MGSDTGKRRSRGEAWRARGMARSLYLRLVTDVKFATRALAIAVVALALCSVSYTHLTLPTILLV